MTSLARPTRPWPGPPASSAACHAMARNTSLTRAAGRAGRNRVAGSEKRGRSWLHQKAMRDRNQEEPRYQRKANKCAAVDQRYRPRSTSMPNTGLANVRLQSQLRRNVTSVPGSRAIHRTRNSGFGLRLRSVARHDVTTSDSSVDQFADFLFVPENGSRSSEAVSSCPGDAFTPRRVCRRLRVMIMCRVLQT